MVEVGRHCWKSSSPTHWSEQAQLQQIASGHVQLGFEYIQGQKFAHLLLRNLLQCLPTVTIKIFFLHLIGIVCISIYACCLLSCPWTPLRGVLFHLVYFSISFLQVFIHLDEIHVSLLFLKSEQS